MPNQRALARHLGLSQITVSRALRNSDLVAPETRKRVFEAAEKMGYRIDPSVTILMERIRSGREITEQGCLAMISDLTSIDEAMPGEVYRTQWENIRKRASRSGYRVELFLTGAPGMSAPKVSRILDARGIRGIIIGNCTDHFYQNTKNVIAWSRYACATLKTNFAMNGFDCACSYHYYNMTLAFQRTMEKGYRRIGVVLPRGVLTKESAAEWLGAYLACQQWVPPAQRLALFLGAPNSSRLTEFKSWYRQQRPDALLCLWGEEMEWLEAMKLTPNELPLVCVNRPVGSIFAGVDENNAVIGELVCTMVINQLIHNQRGIPSHSQYVRVKGTWFDGPTLPEKLKQPSSSTV
jgi:LacI family transcriptional regulator